MAVEAEVALSGDDRFVVQRQLGSGGMGLVDRVLDQVLGREVAAGVVEAAPRADADAETRLGACGLRMHAAFARRARGELLGGGDGATGCAVATPWLRAAAIVDPARLSRVVAPRA